MTVVALMELISVVLQLVVLVALLVLVVVLVNVCDRYIGIMGSWVCHDGDS